MPISPSSSTTASAWPSGWAPTACIWARRTAIRARRARCSVRRCTDRRDLPRQPPPGDGGRRGGGGLCRVRRLLSDEHQGDPAPSRAGDPQLVVGAVRVALRRDRRDHAGKCSRSLVKAGADFLAVSNAVWGGDERSGSKGIRGGCLPDPWRGGRARAIDAHENQARSSIRCFLRNVICRSLILCENFWDCAACLACASVGPAAAGQAGTSGKPPIDYSILHAQVILDHLGFAPGEFSTGARANRSPRR